MPFIRLIKFPSVSIWVLEEVDAKGELNVQEIYWGECLCRMKRGGGKQSIQERSHYCRPDTCERGEGSLGS